MMRMRTSLVLAAAVAVGLTGLAAPAHAQDAAAELGLQMRTVVDRSQGNPAFLLRPQRAVKKLTIRLERDGARPQTLRVGRVGAGQEKVVDFDQSPGTFHYKATFTGQWADGGKLALEITFESTSVEPLTIHMDKKDVDLDGKKLRMRLSRPPERVEYVVLGDGGRELDRGERHYTGHGGDGADTDIELRWSSGAGNVERIKIRAYDRYGFWVGHELIPFTVFIPHDEVEFAFGEAVIRASEEAKLVTTLGELREALDRHAGEIEIQLYIAGYTDTVGNRRDNLDLSEQRAKAIASWFRRRGVRVPIFYQGFGEDVLAVATPDETREPRNRRALYVLSAGAPAPCKPVPRDHWKRL